MLDPNDPRNSKLLLLLDTLPTTSEQVNYFQIVDVENVQSYISENQFHKDKRFTMLSMRDQGVRAPWKIIRDQLHERSRRKNCMRYLRLHERSRGP